MTTASATSAPAPDGRHRRRLLADGVEQEPAPRLGEFGQGVSRIDPSRVQGDELAVTVSGQGVGLDPEGREEVEQTHTRSAQRGLGNIGRGEGGLLAFEFLVADLRRGIDLRTDRRPARRASAASIASKPSKTSGKCNGQLAEHAGRLRPLPGEEEGDPRARSSAAAFGEGDP